MGEGSGFQGLIIIGPGGRADEVLARRRLEAGGRLAHILITDDDEVTVEESLPDIDLSKTSMTLELLTCRWAAGR